MKAQMLVNGRSVVAKNLSEVNTLAKEVKKLSGQDIEATASRHSFGGWTVRTA